MADERPVRRKPSNIKEIIVAVTEEMPQSTGIRDLLEAGLHFGHQTKRWNPKMKRYIFDKRNGIHIIDLAKSLVLLQEASDFLNDVVLSGRSVLFVGTKKQAQKVIEDTAVECGQHYVTHRWLGGTLTNNATIKKSIARFRELEALQKNGDLDTMHKKEAARLRRELEKLRRNLSGVANMARLPGAMFVVDINREAIAVAEANKLGIPVVAMVDTNCNPDPIDYVVPGNDDAIRAIRLVVATLAQKIKAAAEEYARIAAERAKREAEERKAAEAEAKAKREARQQAEAEAAKQRKEAEAKQAAAAKKTEETKEKPKPAAKKEDAKPAAKADEKKPAARKTAARKTAAKPKKADTKPKPVEKEPAAEAADAKAAPPAPEAPADVPAETKPEPVDEKKAPAKASPAPAEEPAPAVNDGQNAAPDAVAGGEAEASAETTPETKTES